MIDENKTLIMFGYTSNELSHGSGKKVWKVCDECHEERLIKYNQYTNLCQSCSHKTKKFRLKISKSHSGENNPMFEKHHTAKTKLKISKSMSGKHHSEETKLKISKSNSGENNSMFGKRGEFTANWKGGKKLSQAKSRVKRRKLFGFIPHNKSQKGFHGHHLDFDNVIFIPKELHKSMYHSVTKNINMKEINDIVCDWYLEYQIPTSN